MDHGYYQSRLSAFADNELPSEEQARVAEHLEQCDECRKRLAELKSLDDLVARHAELEDGDYWEKAASRIEQSVESIATGVTDVAGERRKRGLGLWWKLPAVAASVVIVGYIGLHRSDILREDVIAPPTRLESPSVAPADTDEAALVEERRLPESPSEGVVADIPPTPEETRPVEVESGESKETADIGAVAPSPAVDRAGARRERPLVARPEIALSSEDEPTDVIGAGEVGSEPSPTRQKMAIPKPIPLEQPVDIVEADYLPAADSDRDANYKKDRVRASAAKPSALAETPSPPEAPVDQLGDLADESTDATALDSWRKRRDSLLASLEKTDSEVEPAKRTRGFTGRGDEVDMSTSLAPVSEDSIRSPAEKAEADLLEAWYRICSITTDTTERAEGLKIIDSVASDKRSANRRQARRYLELLDRQ